MKKRSSTTIPSRERERESNTMPRLRSLQLVYLASFLLSSFLFAPPLLAAPPSSPYTPGETLNPTCSPGDANCTVVAPPAGTGSAGLLTYWSASSTVSSSLSLFWDNPNIRLGIGTSQPSSTFHIIAGTTGATTLQLMGLPNQTGNLLTVGSSSGQRYFTISSLGLASSTEFRSPSSTIDTLFLTSASSTNLSLSGYGLFPTLLAQNAVGFGSLSTSTSLVFIQGTQVASTTLNLRGTTNQTANLLTIASSTGINFFTIGPTGLASSTEFRANSSTIASLYDFNGNKYATSSAFTAGVDTQLLFGQLGGGATSSIAFTITTSTSQLLFSGSNVSIAPVGTSTSLVFLQGSQITSTTLNIFGAAAQTASLLSISSSTGIPLFNINAIGQVAIATSTYPSSSTLLTIASSSQIFNISAGGNVMIGTSTSPNAALLQIATTTNIFTILSNGRVGIGTSTPGSALDVKGTLRLSGSASGYVGFAPAAAAGATTYTLPSADGSSGQVLTTDGSGTLSWTTKVEGTSQDFKGLSLRTHPNANIATTTVYLDHADEIVMDTGNRVATWDDLSADITVSGAGGLDTGSEAASTWYEIYAIRKSSDGTKNLLLHRAKDYFLDEDFSTGDDQSQGIRRTTNSVTSVAQQFEVDTSGLVEFVDVYLLRAGSVSGRLWAELYADSGGAPTGSALATSDKIDASLISTSAQWIRLPFRSPVTLSATPTIYHLVLTGDWTQSDTVTISWRADSTSPTYARGSFERKESGSWVEYSDIDVLFKIYVTRNDTSVTMPTGYDQKAKVGYVYNDSGSNFSPFVANDRRVTYQTTFNTGSITATIMTLTDVSSSLPPVAVSDVFGTAENSAVNDWLRILGVPDGYSANGYPISVPTANATVFAGGISTEYQALYFQVSSGTGIFRLRGYTWGSTGGADLAEEYLVDDESINAGDIVSLTSFGTNYVERAAASSSYPVLGIVSTKPGIVLKDWSYSPRNTRNVALTGRVPVKVTEENGPIKTGDRLTLSATTPGYAMKMTEPGQSIGIAMESSENKDPDATVPTQGSGQVGTGKILAFINLTYWIPDISASTSTDASASTSTVASTDFSLDGLMKYIVNKLKNVLEIVFEKGLLKVAHLITDLVETKKVVTEEVVTEKLELKDAATGGVYCVKMLNGQLASVSGGCGSDAQSSTSTAESDSTSSSATSSVSDSDNSDSAASSTDSTADTNSTSTEP